VTDQVAPHSRRSILAAALGGLGGLVAARLGQPAALRAATDDPVLAGNANTADAATSVENTTAGGTSLIGHSAGAGVGVQGDAATGSGVVGRSTDDTPTDDFNVESAKTGVIGTAGDLTNASINTDEIGVYGFADVSEFSVGALGESFAGTGLIGSSDAGFGSAGVSNTGGGAIALGGAVGLLGFSADDQSAGILGDVGPNAAGVYGNTGEAAAPLPPAGVGVYARAETTAQTALQVAGKVKFSRSGRVNVAAGQSSVLVTMAGVTSASYIIATLQTNRSGTHVQSVTPASGRFRIYLNRSVPGATTVGYLVVN
jgi:hypothetical protein